MTDYDEYCGAAGRGQDEGSAGAGWDIDSPELADLLARPNAPILLDVREPHELEISKLNNALNIPLGSLAAHLSELDSAREMVVFCKGGTRSTRALELLVSAGFKKVKNLRGGINAWARSVDTDLPIY